MNTSPAKSKTFTLVVERGAGVLGTGRREVQGAGEEEEEEVIEESDGGEEKQSRSIVSVRVGEGSGFSYSRVEVEGEDTPSLERRISQGSPCRLRTRSPEWR